MVKLTRLNNQVVVVNPDHIYAVEATPDTTLRLASGDRILVRESLEELVTKVVEFRRRVLDGFRCATGGDTAGVAAVTLRQAADDGEDA